MSKVFKGIGKAVKGVVKGIGRVFKKIASSTVGKVLLAGAAIWLGGAALGMWNSPFASVNGALTGGGTAATEVAATTTAATTGATGAAGATGTAAGTAAAAVPVLPSAAVGAGNVAGATAAGNAAGPIAEIWGAAGTAGQNAALNTAITQTGKAATNTMMANITTQAPSLLQKAITGVGNAAKWAEEHETLTTMGTFGLASALSPDETDIMRERERIRQETYDRNLSVGGVNLGMNPSGKPLTDRYGNPLYSKLGLLNRTAGGGT